ncbi:hypothetical protein STEG23_022272 [Scotinomys teguina]
MKEGRRKEEREVESANQDLQNRLLNLESANLMQEPQSINNKCIAKISFVDNKYEYLMDRTLTLQSEVVTTQILCKEERLSLIDKIRSLESCVSEEHYRWYDSMKNLESQAREEVHSLEQTLCARLQALEETLCKHDKEPNKQKGKTIKVITSPNGSNPMAYPVIIHERPADDIHPEPYVTHTLQPISIRDFKNMKEAIVTYGIHSTYVKQMLNSWSTSNRIIPDDWHQLTSAVLEYSQQLQWKSCLREEARNLEQQGKLRGFEISQDQILGEGHFADRNIQATYDEHTISLCRTAALNAWEKIPEPGKQTEVYIKIFQGPREPFTDFLQRLTTAIKKAVSDTELRKLLTETLAFTNANTECKRILTPLKVRLPPLEEWIRYTNDIETFNDGILMQMEDVILEWIFLPHKPNKKLKTYIEKISDLIHKGPWTLKPRLAPSLENLCLDEELLERKTQKPEEIPEPQDGNSLDDQVHCLDVQFLIAYHTSLGLESLPPHSIVSCYGKGLEFIENALHSNNNNSVQDTVGVKTEVEQQCRMLVIVLLPQPYLMTETDPALGPDVKAQVSHYSSNSSNDDLALGKMEEMGDIRQLHRDTSGLCNGFIRNYGCAYSHQKDTYADSPP